MPMSSIIQRIAGIAVCALLPMCCGSASSDEPIRIFDAHSHYKSEDAGVFAPQDVIRIMDREGIDRMVVVGEPPARVQSLYRLAPSRIVPFLGLYEDYTQKASWMHDPTLPGRLRALLDTGTYRGIGEIHLFAGDKANPVFREIVGLAADRGLPILLHGDAEVVQQVFEWHPAATVIWAHLGTQPDPTLVDAMLRRFPLGLYVDTSVRDERFTENGALKPAWRSLFTRHADRVLVAIDTFYVKRWQGIAEVTARIRHWLAQLPPEVADRLAHANADRLFRTEAAAAGAPVDAVPTGRRFD